MARPIRQILQAGLIGLALAPLAVLAAPADTAATHPPPCTGARAVWDIHCPNYTGFQHAIGASAPEASDPVVAAKTPETTPPESLSQRLLKKGRLIEQGMASWYGSQFHGARTASGEVFDKNAYTAAHKTLPLGTRVLVQNLRTGRQVIVRITDRGPHAAGRIIDLSKAAAEVIGMVARGHDKVALHALAPRVAADTEVAGAMR